MFCYTVSGQVYFKGGAFTELGGNGNVTVMLFDDGVTEGQSQTGAFVAVPLLGGKIGIKYVFQ